uniref:Uncharacterized protein n=1 Tax=Arundo donax TaxID=35708 RepID=A0A0A9FZI5_ARUDO
MHLCTVECQNNPRLNCSNLGGAALVEAEVVVEVTDAAEELAQRPIHYPAGDAALVGTERRRPRAPLRCVPARCLHIPGSRGAELLVHSGPVSEPPGDDSGLWRSGSPAEVALAVERRQVARRQRGRGRRRLWLLRGSVALLLVDLDAGGKEVMVRGDEGIGCVHGDIAAPAEQCAVLEVEKVGVAFLAYVALGRWHGGSGGGSAAKIDEGQALMLPREAVRGVDAAAIVRAKCGITLASITSHALHNTFTSIAFFERRVVEGWLGSTGTRVSRSGSGWPLSDLKYSFCNC